MLRSLRTVRVSVWPRRTIFNAFARRSRPQETLKEKATPVLTEDNLFHPFSLSPFPAVRARGETIRSLAPCPVCTSEPPKAVKHECAHCGWPTHCSEEHWIEDKEHDKYCARLTEANEDEHDLRSGRTMFEFELPGPQPYEEAISFANWDVFWYTRGFPSMDTERSRRHASKLLTYPITVGSILHQHSNLTLSNQRLTPEGGRSLAALRNTLHVPTGAPDTEIAGINKPQVRLFILGARAESSLPPHVWDQLCLLFPSAHFHLFFIGPQVSLPKPPETSPKPSEQTSSTHTSSTESSPPPNDKQSAKNYLPNVYQPPTPAPIVRHKRARSSIDLYGVLSYTVPFTPQLTITGMQATYTDVHAHFEDTFDPYTDAFFFFSPGFGFPSLESSGQDSEPLLQIASPTEWGPVIPLLLATKCPIFVTGFSPADVERDVRSLSTAPGVAGEFDWIITPGPNPFGSEKWEIADFDPRVMVKTNWGIWSIRGKSRELQEKVQYDSIRSG